MKKLIAILSFAAMATACNQKIQQSAESSEKPRAKPLTFEHVIVDLCGSNIGIAELRDSIHYYLDLYSSPMSEQANKELVYVDFKLDSSKINAEHTFRLARWYTPTYIRTLGVNLDKIIFLDIECKGMYSTFMLLPNSSVCRFSGNMFEAQQFLQSSLETIRRVPLDNVEATQAFRGQVIGYLNFALYSIYCKDRRIGDPAEINPQAELHKK